MVTINPYLNFAGNTEEAFNFYKSVESVESVSKSGLKWVKFFD